jgi:phenylalanyl-tRNA synthetase beta chain
LHETITWSFVSEEKADLFGIHLFQNKAALTLTNPISSDLAVMRPSILPNLLDAAARNTDRDIGDSALFEIGNVYRSTDAKGQILTASLLRSGNARPRHWAEGARRVDAYDVKADALAALEACGINTAGVQITADAPEWYHPGRSGQIKQGQTVLASFGEIHPGLLAKLKREEAMAAAEIFIGLMPPAKRKGPQKDLLKPSIFQPLRRDFAFIAAAAMTAEQLLRAIRAADKLLITAVEIFDVYQGKGVEPGKKSIGVSVTLQPQDKTLTDAEIVVLCDKIVAAAAQLGAELRR